jgi:hypothetical protein
MGDVAGRGESDPCDTGAEAWALPFNGGVGLSPLPDPM